jgi:hypothetical protein
MRRYTMGFMAALIMAATAVATAQQVPEMPKNVLRVHQSIPVHFVTTPNGRVTALFGGEEQKPLFVFCLRHAKPLAEPLNWNGPATVTYEVMGQIPGFSKSPDQLGIGSGVAILPDAGPGWLVEGAERKAPVRPEDHEKAAKSARIAPEAIVMAPAPRVWFCANMPGGG